VDDLDQRLEDLIFEYGLDEVRQAMARAEDADKERSCADDRPTPAWNE
jgi:hypothetical protein